MMRRRYSILVLALVLVVAATTGVATAAASPENPCQGTEATEAQLFLDTGERIDSEQAYYPGTTVTIYVCGEAGTEPYSTAWGFNANEVPAVSIESERDDSVVLRLGESGEPIDLREGITDKEGVDLGISPIQIQTGYRAQSSITGETLRFPSEPAADTFEGAEGAWQASVEEVENASAALSNVDTESNFSATPDALSTLNNSTLSQRTTDLQRSVIPAARSGDGQAVATIVEESNATAADARSAARESLRSYIETAEQRHSAAVMRVRLFVGGGLVGGLLVGAVVGYVLSRRTLSKIEIDRGVSTATQYSPKQVALPLVLGVLALLAGIAVGALQWPTLFEVIL